MADDFKIFEQAYGRPMPPALSALFADRELMASAPHRIVLPGKPFPVEIQYYRRSSDLDRISVERSGLL